MQGIAKNNGITYATGGLLVLMALTDIMHSKNFMLAGALLSMATFVLCFPIKNTKFFSGSMLFILLLLITSLINLFFTQNNFGGSITLLGSLLLTFVYFSTNKKILTPWVIVSYLAIILFISYNLFILKVNANDIYIGLSRNHAGFAVVFWTVFLLFHLKVAHGRFPLIPPLVAVVLAFFLFGRTSLIVSALLLLVVFFYKFKGKKKLRAIAMSVVVILAYFLWSKYGTLISTETNLGEGLDTPRWELWRIYLENINFTNLFTGIDVTTLSPLYNQFGGNPHNSFIKFHSRVGIGSLVFLGLFFASVLTYLRARQYYIFWLLMLLTLRALFDGDILIGNFDFIFFILTFYWIKND